MEIEFVSVDLTSRDGQDKINARVKELEAKGHKVDVEMISVDKRYAQVMLKVSAKKAERMTG